tara:strand:- start:817 stop:1098 length:282 start_codon:yes stop_codon:yes gene_type:complete
MKYADKKYISLKDIDHNDSYELKFFAHRVGLPSKYDDVRLMIKINKDHSMDLNLLQTGLNFISDKEQIDLIEKAHFNMLERPYLDEYQELIFE